MTSLNPMSCCGIQEVRGIGGNSEKGNLQSILTLYFRNRLPRPATGILIFSDVARFDKSTLKYPAGFKYGEALSKLIKKEGLGTVTVSKSVRNPNSGNLVKAWTWVVDKEASYSFCCKNYSASFEEASREFYERRPMKEIPTMTEKVKTFIKNKIDF